MLCIALSAEAHAFELALSDEADPQPLHWEVEDDGPIVVRHHLLGGEGFYSPLLEAATRRALQSWANLPNSQVSFSEGPIYSGPACPHVLPEGASAELVCGGPPVPADGHSALFFIESNWPFGEEVIALTSVSYEAGGRSVDADISFNGEHYAWSLGESEVHTDYESIVLHELGHLLGLGHSSVADAVMSVDYDDGELARVLHSDDGLGLAHIYPCPSPPCLGGVGYESGGGGCSGSGSRSSSGWSLRAAALPVLFVVLLGFGRRRYLAAGASLSILTLLLLTSPVDSSTALELGMDDLAELSDAVVHARVVGLESWKDGIAWTRVELEVVEAWKGERDQTIELVQPGGFTGDFGTLVFGMPRFEQGEEVAVFLTEQDGAPRVVGLSQGKFRIDAEGILSRDLSGLAFARVGGHRVPRAIRAPAELGQLRLQIQGAGR